MLCVNIQECDLYWLFPDRPMTGKGRHKGGTSTDARRNFFLDSLLSCWGRRWRYTPHAPPCNRAESYSIPYTIMAEPDSAISEDFVSLLIFICLRTDMRFLEVYVLPWLNLTWQGIGIWNLDIGFICVLALMEFTDQGGFF